ncbi:MAG: beta-eliminating lyase-related protein [Actinomycetota bacterium]|nr:beta-eliminating lyase-related protein [Actinomycetota bacterium]
MHPIELRSDNCAGVAPEIMNALAEANVGSALAYGGDDHTAHLRDLVREVFEHPSAEVFPVISGTAANSLGLSAICPPWGSVLCHETAHILRNECGATSMFGGGAVMRGLAGHDFKLQPTSLEVAFAATNWGDPHHSQPSAVSLTCPTDMGTVYSVAEVQSLAAAAAGPGLRMHLDGARVANAIVALGCAPAELLTHAGVHVFSLGATKNGALSTDAIVCLDPAVSEQLLYRVKRAGHVASKMRFQSAQLQAYLTDGLWLRLARQANDAMAALAAGLCELGAQFVVQPQANILFANVGAPAAASLAATGLLFYEMNDGLIRLVTSFQTTEADVQEILRRAAPVLTATN